MNHTENIDQEIELIRQSVEANREGELSDSELAEQIKVSIDRLDLIRQQILSEEDEKFVSDAEVLQAALVTVHQQTGEPVRPVQVRPSGADIEYVLELLSFLVEEKSIRPVDGGYIPE